jgi:hypothetical protein
MDLPRIKKVIKKAASITNRIRFIRQSLDEEQTLKVLTSYLYSSVYNSAPVWLGSVTCSEGWKLLNKMHYQALRLATHNHWKIMSRKSLDARCKRAIPRQWGYYTTTSRVCSMLENGQPSLLCYLIKGNMSQNSRKPNRLGDIFRQLHFDWYRMGQSKPVLRMKLKKTFFPYYSSDN